MFTVYLCVFGASWTTGSLEALWGYWVLPRIVAEPLMRVILLVIRLSEHGGCAEVPDMLRNTRTVMAMPQVRQLNWNMRFHTEHHALASVPFHRLPAAYHLLKAHLEEISSGYMEALRHKRLGLARPIGSDRD